jgi:ribose 5-phosphate isomerase A
MGEDGKRAAGFWAADLVEPGMRLGLGTGSTVDWFLQALADRGLDVAGVPTSEATAERCRELGIRLLDPDDIPGLDLVVDGADEIDPRLNLTKGGGGALLREKVVAAGARRMVVIATPDKQVERLGDTFAIPLEIVPFATAPVRTRLEDMGFEVTLREDGRYRTDNGNAILDARLEGGIADPTAAEGELALVPGICESGLFVGLAGTVALGHDDGRVTVLDREA